MGRGMGFILERVLAERCPACGGRTGRGLCAHCRGELTPLEDSCSGCGLPRPVRHCPRRQAPWSLAGVLAAYDYRHPLDRYIVALKFQRARRLGRALGLLLADAARARPHGTARVDALVPVPLHRARLRERGYNQAFEIARTVSAELGLPMLTRGVVRRKATAPQSGFHARERYGNVRRAFEMRRTDLEGRRLAIVDDVITTGATVNALAAALTSAGAAEVRAWAVARAV